MFLNYKHYFSVVLMAVVDSDYNFIFVDIGAHGKECDYSVFKETRFWRSPADIKPTGSNTLGDEAFALHNLLLRPFGGYELNQLK
nr:unnamed protein product [Callosobruchus analis]